MNTSDEKQTLLWDGQRSYQWDAENRLVRITHPGGATTFFAYDGLGRRVLVSESQGSIRRHVWEGLRLAAEYDAYTGDLQRRYWSEGEEQFLPPGQSGPAIPLYYVRDHLGSVRELVDAEGRVRARYDYGLWGERHKLAGDLATSAGYTGHYYHAPSTLHLAPYRAYSADLGRWLSRDPIGENGGINLYGYVANDPVNWVDPLGLITIVMPGAGPQNRGSNGDFVDRVSNMHSDAQQFGRHQRAQQRALDAIRDALAKNPCEEVNIYGYSRGGIGALELAEKLNQAGIPVDNLVLVDPVTVTGNGGGLNVPSNVRNAESHYQGSPRQGPLDFPGTPLNNPGPGRSNTTYPGPHQNMPGQFQR